jgi:transposase
VKRKKREKKKKIKKRRKSKRKKKKRKKTIKRKVKKRKTIDKRNHLWVTSYFKNVINSTIYSKSLHHLYTH